MFLTVKASSDEKFVAERRFYYMFLTVKAVSEVKFVAV